ncbi:Uncharacterised protein [Candidatus Tiddalikarchaeum anstoanum]|nr:Uncharacterised protein [Candidatus Tiddalikarchaeum anstoanum]
MVTPDEVLANIADKSFRISEQSKKDYEKMTKEDRDFFNDLNDEEKNEFLSMNDQDKKTFNAFIFLKEKHEFFHDPKRKAELKKEVKKEMDDFERLKEKPKGLNDREKRVFMKITDEERKFILTIENINVIKDELNSYIRLLEDQYAMSLFTEGKGETQIGVRLDTLIHGIITEMNIASIDNKKVSEFIENNEYKRLKNESVEVIINLPKRDLMLVFGEEIGFISKVKNLLNTKELLDNKKNSVKVSFDKLKIDIRNAINKLGKISEQELNDTVKISIVVYLDKVGSSMFEGVSLNRTSIIDEAVHEVLQKPL